MSEISVQLHSWLRMQRESLPLAVRADALLRALHACPEVRQAFFLRWQAGTSGCCPGWLGGSCTRRRRQGAAGAARDGGTHEQWHSQQHK